ncbi:tyrosine-type recombinase/integrase [Flavobacterium johnsoniae]|uniref:Phage integrase family protein n=1 Tax=Flavobacterium johnsoniae (strain ATCC 17061 / DSM 2064 / JCM 8514 / BCRC 14874 / CCUG 350202 / NBRC 14942 / NCIMB 11054 / UW101) TaxID=376686 RepID=A5FDK0_FLAJ1|nr:tyrosine-type recombinase/integrase [Flavobacterium johnsoniae]ABQ06714.1 phage integrase family protein [Flavobacterium johnsoniae UW101]OXE95259.1 integrase [Flavobacterium johnsoniae UW101]WQG82472.1 tyrosine-type recombinase/integrase [Flavobacterium johnsoniae UW101]SHM02357.1 Site-specific recombinase XerD [Flavobacterium johnsoniae]
MKTAIKNTAFQNLLRDFDSYVKVKNYKQGKGSMYQTAVSEFLIWLEKSGINSIRKVTGRESVSYYEHLISRPKHRGNGTLAEKTIKFHLFALGLFVLNLLENNQIEKAYYIPSYSGESGNSRNALSVEEIRMLYQHCENDLQRALISTAYGCGLRRSEIEALNTRDIQLSRGMVIVRDGKGSKRREVPMSDMVAGHIKKYIAEERYEKLKATNRTEDAFFIYDSGKRMNGEYLNSMLKKIVGQTSSYELIQKDITLHCLRHSIASHLMEKNAGIDFIRGFLGHSQINTTYIYAVKNKRKKPVTTF